MSSRAISGSGSASGSYVDSSIMSPLQIRLTTTYIEKMRYICDSFFKRASWIQEGRPLDAVSEKPSGIWYGNVYALALRSLGSTPVPVKKKAFPASTLYKALRNQFDFYCFKAHGTFWKRIPVEGKLGGCMRTALQMADDVKPSEAFQSLLENLTFVDCKVVLQISIYLALLEIYGEKKFNQVMQALIATNGPIFLGSHRGACTFTENITTHCDSIDATSSELGLILGQSFYLSNVSNYANKHPFGIADGYNLIYIGDNSEGKPLFIGLELNPKGVTLREIAEILIARYNEPPISPDLILPKDAAAKQHTMLNFKLGSIKMSIILADLPDYISGAKLFPPIPPESFRQFLPQYEEYQRSLEKQITMPELLSNPSLFNPKKTYQVIDSATIEKLFGTPPSQRF